MSEVRVALCGQGQLIREFIAITPPHPSLRVDDLSRGGPEACEDAFRSYPFTVLMYEDQDSNALIWAHSLVRLHSRCRGSSRVILAPVVVEHLGLPPTLLQEFPISIKEPDEAFHLLDLIATGPAPRHGTMFGPTNPVPSVPGQSATPRELRQQKSRSKLKKAPSGNLEVQMSTTQDIACQWKAIQERLRRDEEALDRMVSTLSIALLMLLDVADLPRVRRGELRDNIGNRVFAPNRVTHQGLFEFLSHMAGMSLEEGLLSQQGTSISKLIAEGRLRSRIGAFFDEDMDGNEWVPIDPKTVHEVFTQHISQREWQDTEIDICNLSKWPGMECYFINLYAQNINDRAGRIVRGLVKGGKLYRRWTDRLWSRG